MNINYLHKFTFIAMAWSKDFIITYSRAKSRFEIPNSMITFFELLVIIFHDFTTLKSKSIVNLQWFVMQSAIKALTIKFPKVAPGAYRVVGHGGTCPQALGGGHWGATPLGCLLILFYFFLKYYKTISEFIEFSKNFSKFSKILSKLSTIL